MEHRRVVNPYHSVSISTDPKCCQEVHAIEERRFLAVEAPQLPLPGCGAAQCNCRYVHHDDRRSTENRRVQAKNRRAYSRTERREGKGRRVND
ncbi:MAG: hypothetical protein ACRER4_06825 [Steroidobacteraceae bacterium]